MRTFGSVVMVICFGIILIISLPIVILSNGLLQYGIINHSEPFYYYTNDPSLIEELYIVSDFGDIEINYLTQPEDYSVKITVSIEMGGIDLGGKSYSDFFKLDWQNTSNKLSFSLHFKEGIDLMQVISQIRNIEILVTPRANVICNLDVNLHKGNANINLPYGRSAGNILTNISIGDIKYDFSYCKIDGNITGTTQNGNINMDCYECEYLDNSRWSLFTEKGNIEVNLNQLNEIGANITGNITTLIGNYRISYRDQTPDVGAFFVLQAHPDDFAIHQQLLEITGFEFNVSSINGNDIYYLFSDDFPARNNYNLTFTMPIGVYEDIYFYS